MTTIKLDGTALGPRQAERVKDALRKLHGERWKSTEVFKDKNGEDFAMTIARIGLLADAVPSNVEAVAQYDALMGRWASIPLTAKNLRAFLEDVARAYQAAESARPVTRRPEGA